MISVIGSNSRMKTQNPEQVVLSEAQIKEEIRKFEAEEARKKEEKARKVGEEQNAEKEAEEEKVEKNQQIKNPLTQLPTINPLTNRQTPVQSKKSKKINLSEIYDQIFIPLIFFGGILTFAGSGLYGFYSEKRRSTAEEKIKLCSGIEQVILTPEKDLKFYLQQIKNSDSSFSYLKQDTLLEKIYSTNPQLNPNTDFIPGKTINLPVYKQGEQLK